MKYTCVYTEVALFSILIAKVPVILKVKFFFFFFFFSRSTFSFKSTHQVGIGLLWFLLKVHKSVQL